MEIIALFSIGETAYKINKYMIIVLYHRFSKFYVDESESPSTLTADSSDQSPPGSQFVDESNLLFLANFLLYDRRY